MGLGILLGIGLVIYEAIQFSLSLENLSGAVFYSLPILVTGLVFLIKKEDVRSHKAYHALLILFTSSLALFIFSLIGMQLLCSAGPSQECGAAGVVPFLILMPLTILTGIIFLFVRILRLRNEQRSVTATVVSTVGLVVLSAFGFYFLFA